MNETNFPQTFELIKGLAVFKHSINEFVITHKIVKKALIKVNLIYYLVVMTLVQLQMENGIRTKE